LLFVFFSTWPPGFQTKGKKKKKRFGGH
jgi:hypothetical protein